MRMNTPVSVTKSNGTRELFDERKLTTSLERSGASPEAALAITDEIERKMWDGMPTTDIYARAFALLRAHHHPTAVKYSLRRALMELGPDGFPFEKFVARIFRLWGYEAVTDQTLMGACVEHEVDVVAWKGDELSMVEAKYHNESGLRSDVKVALYVKARFDDLSETVFDFGGTRRMLSPNGRWLFTNTKFTEVAIRYGECKGMKLVGWNHPAKNNLHQIMEQNGLHPVTAMTTLSKQEKHDLIGRGVLVCIDLIGAPDALRQIGLKADRAEAAITEAQMIVEQAK